MEKRGDKDVEMRRCEDGGTGGETERDDVEPRTQSLELDVLGLELGAQRAPIRTLQLDPRIHRTLLGVQVQEQSAPLKRSAVIVAAGRGTRMGEDKVWMPLCSMPVVAHSLKAFKACAGVECIILVVGRDKLDRARSLVDGLGVDAIVCEGGNRRQDSVANGLALLDGGGLVAIHDGARPMVTSTLIESCYEEAEIHGAAVAAIPVRDTIKKVTRDGWVYETLDRASLWAVQTPQVFLVDLIRSAYGSLYEEVTDDAAAVERLGHPVKIVQGSPFNLKLTTREDLLLARALMGDLEESC